RRNIDEMLVRSWYRLVARGTGDSRVAPHSPHRAEEGRRHRPYRSADRNTEACLPAASSWRRGGRIGSRADRHRPSPRVAPTRSREDAEDTKWHIGDRKRGV